MRFTCEELLADTAGNGEKIDELLNRADYISVGRGIGVATDNGATLHASIKATPGAIGASATVIVKADATALLIMTIRAEDSLVIDDKGIDMKILSIRIVRPEQIRR